MAQMERVPDQMALREASAAYLDRELPQIDGIRPLRRDPRVTAHAHHLYIFRYNAAGFGGLPRDRFIQAVRAEGIPCHGGYTPLTDETAIRTEVARLCRLLGRRDDPLAVAVPVTHRACAEAIWLSQSLMLSEMGDVADVVAAVTKVQRHAARLARV
jgi:dTDP-4-amino-4,6-dideoxygalactose transaminase